jgi:addiction module HigA family antidote
LHRQSNNVSYVKRGFTGYSYPAKIAKIYDRSVGYRNLTQTDNVRLIEPSHPGSFVKNGVLAPHGLSVTDAADVLGVTRPALSALLNERAHLSPEMALRLEMAFGVSMETLMRMQNDYDISLARKRASKIRVAPYKGKSGTPPLPSSTGADHS